MNEQIWVGPEWVGSEIVGYRFRCMRKQHCLDEVLAISWGLSPTIQSYELAWELGLDHAQRACTPTVERAVLKTVECGFESHRAHATRGGDRNER